MRSPQPAFTLAVAEQLGVSDQELTDLLREVYVGGGFTTADEAQTLFAPAAVRSRGFIIAARVGQDAILAGMAIVVPPDSPARRLAADNEAELQLLAVRTAYRRHGLGRMLVEAAVDKAARLCCPKIMLWTQRSMEAAQHLYAATGFHYARDFDRGGRRFKVYERSTATKGPQESL